MKRLFLIIASATMTSAAMAQMGNNDALFGFNGGEPTEVSQLGTAPEFPFLANKSSAAEVYNAIKRRANDNTEAMRHLNGLLMEIGYANGASDLEQGDVTMEWIKPGTVGNMGSRGYTYGLYRLTGDASEFKAWKIAPNDGDATGALYLFAKCGNAFYPRQRTTACVNVPVQVTPDVNQITLPASGSKVTTNNKTYVYYERKRHKKDDVAYPVAGLNAQYPSDIMEVDQRTDMSIRPEMYTVSLNGNQTEVAACENRPLSLTANVNVEKTATYTGNYPAASNNATYVKVSKRHYKMIARKMHNAERKANKIAKKTEMEVHKEYTPKPEKDRKSKKA